MEDTQGKQWVQDITRVVFMGALLHWPHWSDDEILAYDQALQRLGNILGLDKDEMEDRAQGSGLVDTEGEPL